MSDINNTIGFGKLKVLKESECILNKYDAKKLLEVVEIAKKINLDIDEIKQLTTSTDTKEFEEKIRIILKNIKLKP